ncbi:MAG TPA: DUF222 domain-containing protein, partial [bacterium]|nr:DUF222 domain-containing protein [bacterium]
KPEERSVYRRQLPGGMIKLVLVLVLEPDEADLILRAVDRAQEVRAEQGAEQPVRGLPQPQKAEAAEPAEARECPKEPTQPPGKREDVSAEACWPSRVDGLVTAAESFLAGHPVSGTGGERYQVMVHLDQEALGPDGAWAATLEDGTRVSAEALRRVACDCGLVAVGHDGEALDIGRRTRSIPPAIRRALMLRDRGCAFPGCTHTRFLHAHHISHWLHGGATSLGNLTMMCGHHHHLVHEGGWTITAVEGGTLVFNSPQGRSIAAAPPREPVDDLPGWLGEWAEERNLALGPEINMPRWDGKNPDYDLAVSGLLARSSRAAVSERFMLQAISG